jgi:hypothetical protein
VYAPVLGLHAIAYSLPYYALAEPLQVRTATRSRDLPIIISPPAYTIKVLLEPPGQMPSEPRRANMYGIGCTAPEALG